MYKGQAPVVILAVQVIGLVMSTDAAMARIMAQLQETIGADAAETVRTAVAASQIDQGGILPTLIGVGAGSSTHLTLPTHYSV